MSRKINRERAGWAAQALDAYVTEHNIGDDDEAAVHDLIADLGHYCSVNKLDFVQLIAKAAGTWAFERSDAAGIGARPHVTVAIADRTKSGQQKARIAFAPTVLHLGHADEPS